MKQRRTKPAAISTETAIYWGIYGGGTLPDILVQRRDRAKAIHAYMPDEVRQNSFVRRTHVTIKLQRNA